MMTSTDWSIFVDDVVEEKQPSKVVTSTEPKTLVIDTDGEKPVPAGVTEMFKRIAAHKQNEAIKNAAVKTEVIKPEVIKTEDKQPEISQQQKHVPKQIHTKPKPQQTPTSKQITQPVKVVSSTQAESEHSCITDELHVHSKVAPMKPISKYAEKVANRTTPQLTPKSQLPYELLPQRDKDMLQFILELSRMAKQFVDNEIARRIIYDDVRALTITIAENDQWGKVKISKYTADKLNISKEEWDTTKSKSQLVDHKVKAHLAGNNGLITRHHIKPVREFYEELLGPNFNLEKAMKWVETSELVLLLVKEHQYLHGADAFNMKVSIDYL